MLELDTLLKKEDIKKALDLLMTYIEHYAENHLDFNILTPDNIVKVLDVELANQDSLLRDKLFDLSDDKQKVKCIITAAVIVIIDNLLNGTVPTSIVSSVGIYMYISLCALNNVTNLDLNDALIDKSPAFKFIPFQLDYPGYYPAIRKFNTVNIITDRLGDSLLDGLFSCEYLDIKNLHIYGSPYTINIVPLKECKIENMFFDSTLDDVSYFLNTLCTILDIVDSSFKIGTIIFGKDVDQLPFIYDICHYINVLDISKSSIKYLTENEANNILRFVTGKYSSGNNFTIRKRKDQYVYDIVNNKKITIPKFEAICEEV